MLVVRSSGIENSAEAISPLPKEVMRKKIRGGCNNTLRRDFAPPRVKVQEYIFKPPAVICLASVRMLR